HPFGAPETASHPHDLDGRGAGHVALGVRDRIGSRHAQAPGHFGDRGPVHLGAALARRHAHRLPAAAEAVDGPIGRRKRPCAAQSARTGGARLTRTLALVVLAAGCRSAESKIGKKSPVAGSKPRKPPLLEIIAMSRNILSAAFVLCA